MLLWWMDEWMDGTGLAHFMCPPCPSGLLPIFTKILYQVTHKRPHCQGIPYWSWCRWELPPSQRVQTVPMLQCWRAQHGITHPSSFGCSAFVSLGKKKYIKGYHLISFNLPYEYPLENHSTQGVFNYTFNLYKAYWKLPLLYPFSLDGELWEILARRNLSKWWMFWWL